MAAPVLKWPDYLIFVSFLVISVGIGIYHSLTGGRQKTTAEFIMADRRLKVLPTAISLLVSFQSAISLLGLSAETYYFGIQYLIFAGICSTIAAMLIVGRLFIPLFYPLKLISVNEYLERRFMSRYVRMFATSLGILAGVLYIGATMFVTSAALESATGLSLKISVPLMAFVSVTYTALGGMRAVIWTDVFQFIIMVGGMAAIFIKGMMSVGGFANVFLLAEKEGRLNWVDFSPDPRVRHTVWGLTIALTIMWTHAYGLSQASVQRYSAVEKLSKARLTVLINLPPLVTMNVINCFMGLVVLAYYSTTKCDPLANGDVGNINQLLPFFVFSIFADAPGFAGVFLATLYGASLSSVSTSLSGSAANIWEDLLQWKLAKLPESRKALINRLLIVMIGVLSYGVAFLAAFVQGPITQVVGALVSSAGGPILGLFLLGATSRYANAKGTLIGGFVGLVFCLWLSIGSLTMHRRPPYLPPVSVEGCKAIGNDSLLAFDYFNSTDFNETVNGNFESHLYENTTQRTLVKPLPNEELHGLENFYAISYVWFGTFAVAITMTVGLTASMIFRDKDRERKVEERYLIRYRNLFECRCDEDDYHEEDSADEKRSLNEEVKKNGKSDTNGSASAKKPDKLLESELSKILDDEESV